MMKTERRRREKRPTSEWMRLPLLPVVVAAVVVVVGVDEAVLVTVGAAVLVTALGSTVAVVPEGVVGEDLPPVRPNPSLSSSDWSCKPVHDRTSVSFSYNFRSLRLDPRRF